LRILFAFPGGTGHFLPMASIARAAEVAGHAVLADQTYRRHAERMRDEIAALPGPEHAVTLLERLAAERRPLPSR
jgi:UDP:flavonoid glycosyltransferase YjiC (YdhE family)